MSDFINISVNKLVKLEGLMFCIQCNKLFIENKDTKDHGICSLNCGYRYRGLHWSDFL